MHKRTARPRTVATAVAAALMMLPLVAVAQLGSGWTRYMPPEDRQIRGCAAHSTTGGVDQFRVTCADMGGDNRAEHRTQNDYSSGTNQFEGEIRVVTPGANIIVKQTFMPNRGAFFMMAVSADGRLYLHGGGGDVLPNVVGRWVRINTIHDVAAGTHKVYADGVLRTTKSGGGRVAWHDKYGSYRSQSGRGPAVIEWRNIKYFRGGQAPNASNPPPPPPPSQDAGAADAAVDATPLTDAAANPDAGAGGGGGSGPGGEGGAGGSSSGSGGAGGSAGSGGTTGTGGTTSGAGGRGMGGRGAGGSPAAGTPPPPESGGGCSFGSRSPGGQSRPGLWTLAGILIVLAVSRGRRRAR